MSEKKTDSGSTDAVKAGQQSTEAIVSKITGLFSNPMFMVALYFYGWPLIRSKIWGAPEVDKDGVPIPIPAEPFNFFTFVTKGICYMLFFGVAMLLMIYFKQEGMLYAPSQPYQLISDNPPRYKNPGERGMEYEEIWITGKDGTKLQGWFIY
jgi:hypothetical protein